MTMKHNGFVLYHGASILDGAPIVAIVTGTRKSSANAKTGAMLQTWIMRADQAPTVALKSGADASICGQCPRRPKLGGDCYVNVARAPLAVWNAWQRGAYPVSRDHMAIGAGRNVRLGSYGDPAAVPAYVWQVLTMQAKMHTGYTHQWRTAAPEYRALCMASVDSRAELNAARAAGWRAFRVRYATEPLAPRESVCPASEEAGKRLTCETCGACNGAQSGRHGSIAIVAHGVASKRIIRLRALG
jgi:hypothetical protein